MVQAKIVGATHIGLLVVCREKWGLLQWCREQRTPAGFFWFTSLRSTHSSIMLRGKKPDHLNDIYVNIYHDHLKLGSTSTTCPFLRKPTLGQCALAFQVCEELIDPGVNSVSETTESNQCHRAEHPKVRISVAESGSINGRNFGIIRMRASKSVTFGLSGWSGWDPTSPMQHLDPEEMPSARWCRWIPLNDAFNKYIHVYHLGVVWYLPPIYGNSFGMVFVEFPRAVRPHGAVPPRFSGQGPGHMGCPPPRVSNEFQWFVNHRKLSIV